MKHTGIAGVLGAALLVATFSAQMTAKTLVPTVPQRSASVAAAMRIAANLP